MSKECIKRYQAKVEFCVIVTCYIYLNNVTVYVCRDKIISTSHNTNTELIQHNNKSLIDT